MHSRKLPDLSNEAAMLDTCCTMCSGLSRLLEDGSNLLDVVTALVHTHPSSKNTDQRLVHYKIAEQKHI